MLHSVLYCTCIFFICAIKAFKLKQKHWKSVLHLNPKVYKELQWWMDYVSNWNVCPVQICPVQTQVVTHASYIAWGAILEGHPASG